MMKRRDRIVAEAKKHGSSCHSYANFSLSVRLVKTTFYANDNGRWQIVVFPILW